MITEQEFGLARLAGDVHAWMKDNSVTPDGEVLAGEVIRSTAVVLSETVTQAMRLIMLSTTQDTVWSNVEKLQGLKQWHAENIEALNNIASLGK